MRLMFLSRFTRPAATSRNALTAATDLLADTDRNNVSAVAAAVALFPHDLAALDDRQRQPRKVLFRHLRGDRLIQGIAAHAPGDNQRQEDTQSALLLGQPSRCDSSASKPTGRGGSPSRPSNGLGNVARRLAFLPENLRTARRAPPTRRFGGRWRGEGLRSRNAL